MLLAGRFLPPVVLTFVIGTPGRLVGERFLRQLSDFFGNPFDFGCHMIAVGFGHRRHLRFLMSVKPANDDYVPMFLVQATRESAT